MKKLKNQGYKKVIRELERYQWGIALLRIMFYIRDYLDRTYQSISQ